MKFRLALQLLAALILTVVTATVLITGITQGQKSSDKEIPIIVEQLQQADGLSPIYVMCEKGRLTMPDTVEKISCVGTNNTNKNITAFSALLTIITEKEGEESQNTNVLYNDSLVHPDIRKAMGLKLTFPSAGRTLGTAGPISFEDEIINRIQLKVDYVEFEDGTSVSSGDRGAQVIGSIREGAARYKAWLARQYAAKRDGRAVVALLQETDIPSELKFGGNQNLMQGARTYRSIIQRMYESRGETALTELLDK